MIDCFGNGNALDCYIALGWGFALVLECLGLGENFGVLVFCGCLGSSVWCLDYLGFFRIGSSLLQQQTKNKNQKIKKTTPFA